MTDPSPNDTPHSNREYSASSEEAEQTGDRKPFVEPQLHRHTDLVDATASTHFS